VEAVDTIAIKTTTTAEVMMILTYLTIINVMIMAVAGIMIVMMINQRRHNAIDK
jgi:hypothetical protein